MPHNEDAVLIAGTVIVEGTSEQLVKPPFIAAVSDGVSGERSGEIASKTCLELISKLKYDSGMSLENELLDIHRILAAESAMNPETHNMQATLCGIAVNEKGEMCIFNVGDSRLYRYRGGRIKQLSRDQSLVQLLYEEGSITMEQRRTHVHRNIIFPVFGNINTVPKIDITPIPGGMQYGDVLMICTDGLSDHISPLDMEEFLERPRSMKTRLEMMVKKALEKGCKDNISAIAIVYREQ